MECQKRCIKIINITKPDIVSKLDREYVAEKKSNLYDLCVKALGNIKYYKMGKFIADLNRSKALLTKIELFEPTKCNIKEYSDIGIAQFIKRVSLDEISIAIAFSVKISTVDIIKILKPICDTASTLGYTKAFISIANTQDCGLYIEDGWILSIVDENTCELYKETFKYL